MSGDLLNSGVWVLIIGGLVWFLGEVITKGTIIIIGKILVFAGLVFLLLAFLMGPN